MANLKSPVTNSESIKKVRSFDAQQLQKDYNDFGIDVQNYFDGVKTVDLYECIESGLQFFSPNNIVGDGKFYESIQHFDWYYKDDKWEFDKGLSLINGGEKVLEIGSGRGQFLKLLKQKTEHAEGLELNESAIEKIRANGYKVHLMKIDEFEQQLHQDSLFDVVCSFQVYEHIDNIGEVIQSSLNALKQGGRLIISVPNSDCIFNDPILNPFNMPPHHQGLWYPSTFEKLQSIFNIELTGVYFEPSSFINKFRAAAVDCDIKKREGTTSSFQYYNSLMRIFKEPRLQRGRTMIAQFIKK
ncbi:MAG: class I SAM-dependent methyltransferase [Chitinophagaceae bacterium]|nr:class I SAM-dependent methyltransferase [Chitinophagaceae bacterium]